MIKYDIVRNVVTSEIFAVVIHRDNNVSYKGISPKGEQWALWAQNNITTYNAKHLSSDLEVIRSSYAPTEDDLQTIISNIQQKGINMSNKTKVGDRVKTGAISMTPSFREFQLAVFDPEVRGMVVDFKALAFVADSVASSKSLAKRFGIGRPNTASGEISTKAARPRLGARIGGGLRSPSPGMAFVDVTGQIDADADGIVFERTPMQRPIIPRLNVDGSPLQVPRTAAQRSQQAQQQAARRAISAQRGQRSVSGDRDIEADLDEVADRQFREGRLQRPSRPQKTVAQLRQELEARRAARAEGQGSRSRLAPEGRVQMVLTEGELAAIGETMDRINNDPNFPDKDSASAFSEAVSSAIANADVVDLSQEDADNFREALIQYMLASARDGSPDTDSSDIAGVVEGALDSPDGLFVSLNLTEDEQTPTNRRIQQNALARYDIEAALDEAADLGRGGGARSRSVRDEADREITNMIHDAILRRESPELFTSEVTRGPLGTGRGTRGEADLKDVVKEIETLRSELKRLDSRLEDLYDKMYDDSITDDEQLEMDALIERSDQIEQRIDGFASGAQYAVDENAKALVRDSASRQLRREIALMQDEIRSDVDMSERERTIALDVLNAARNEIPSDGFFREDNWATWGSIDILDDVGLLDSLEIDPWESYESSDIEDNAREMVDEELLQIESNIRESQRQGARSRVAFPDVTPDEVRQLSESSLSDIAAWIRDDIRRSGKKVPFGAAPYLDAMSSLDTIDDRYGQDDARSIVAYALSNLTAYRGPGARAAKAELKRRLDSRSRGGMRSRSASNQPLSREELDSMSASELSSRLLSDRFDGMTLDEVANRYGIAGGREEARRIEAREMKRRRDAGEPVFPWQSQAEAALSRDLARGGLSQEDIDRMFYNGIADLDSEEKRNAAREIVDQFNDNYNYEFFPRNADNRGQRSRIIDRLNEARANNQRVTSFRMLADSTGDRGRRGMQKEWNAEFIPAYPNASFGEIRVSWGREGGSLQSKTYSGKNYSDFTDLVYGKRERGYSVDSTGAEDILDQESYMKAAQAWKQGLLSRVGKGGKSRIDTVGSSAVSAMSWDDDKKELIVTFPSGKTYTYSNNIPGRGPNDPAPDLPGMVRELEVSESIGRTLNDIKRQGFAFTQDGEHAPEISPTDFQTGNRRGAGMRSSVVPRGQRGIDWGYWDEVAGGHETFNENAAERMERLAEEAGIRSDLYSAARDGIARDFRGSPEYNDALAAWSSNNMPGREPGRFSDDEIALFESSNEYDEALGEVMSTLEAGDLEAYSRQGRGQRSRSGSRSSSYEPTRMDTELNSNNDYAWMGVDYADQFRESDAYEEAFMEWASGEGIDSPDINDETQWRAFEDSDLGVQAGEVWADEEAQSAYERRVEGFWGGDISSPRWDRNTESMQYGQRSRAPKPNFMGEDDVAIDMMLEETDLISDELESFRRMAENANDFELESAIKEILEALEVANDANDMVMFSRQSAETVADAISLEVENGEGPSVMLGRVGALIRDVIDAGDNGEIVISDALDESGTRLTMPSEAPRSRRRKLPFRRSGSRSRTDQRPQWNVDVTGSSALQQASYDETNRELIVTFANGQTYAYGDFDFDELPDGPLTGRMVNELKKTKPVRKGGTHTFDPEYQNITGPGGRIGRQRLRRSGSGTKTQIPASGSSAIEALTWDDNKKDLIVTYNGGRTYTYKDVDDYWVDELEDTPNETGRIINNIKKEGYRVETGGEHGEMPSTGLQNERARFGMRSRTYTPTKLENDFDSRSVDKFRDSDEYEQAFSDWARSEGIRNPDSNNESQWRRFEGSAAANEAYEAFAVDYEESRLGMRSMSTLRPSDRFTGPRFGLGGVSRIDVGSSRNVDAITWDDDNKELIVTFATGRTETFDLGEDAEKLIGRLEGGGADFHIDKIDRTYPSRTGGVHAPELSLATGPITPRSSRNIGFEDISRVGRGGASRINTMGSRAVQALTWDDDDNSLIVTFSNGQTYTYNIPNSELGVIQRLENARSGQSVGSIINSITSDAPEGRGPAYRNPNRLEFYRGGEHADEADLSSPIQRARESIGMRSRTTGSARSRAAAATAERSQARRGMRSATPKPGESRMSDRDGRLWNSLTDEEKATVMARAQKLEKELFKKFKSRFRETWMDAVEQSQSPRWRKREGWIDEETPFTAILFAMDSQVREAKTRTDLSPKMRADIQREMDDLRTLFAMRGNKNYEFLEHLHGPSRAYIFDDAKRNDGETTSISAASARRAPSTAFDVVRKDVMPPADETTPEVDPDAPRVPRTVREKTVAWAEKMRDSVLYESARRRRLREMRKQRNGGQNAGAFSADERSPLKPLERKARLAKRAIILKKGAKRDVPELANDATKNRVNGRLAIRGEDGTITISDGLATALGAAFDADQKHKRLAKSKKKAPEGGWRNEDLAFLWDGAGFNGTPMPINRDQYDALVQAGWTPLVRGHGAERYAEDYIDDPVRFIPGQGGEAAGPGEYFALMPQGKNWYGFVRTDEASATVALLPPDARRVSQDDLRNVQKEHRKLAQSIRAFDSGLPDGEREKMNGADYVEQLNNYLRGQLGDGMAAAMGSDMGQIIAQLLNQLSTASPSKKRDILDSLKYLNSIAYKTSPNYYAPILGFDAISVDERELVMNRTAVVVLGETKDYAGVVEVSDSVREARRR